MPYIKQELRELLNSGEDPGSVGALNYVITSIINNYIVVPSYERYNEVIGVLECAKLELYRRMVAPYEDAAKDRNGDVY